MEVKISFHRGATAGQQTVQQNIKVNAIEKQKSVGGKPAISFYTNKNSNLSSSVKGRSFFGNSSHLSQLKLADNGDPKGVPFITAQLLSMGIYSFLCFK
jgi:hypothetical protein